MRTAHRARWPGTALRCALAAAALVLSAAARAGTLEVGSTLPPLTLEDQHERAHTLDDSVHLVLYSRDMDGGRHVREALEGQGADVLERHDAVYIADISGMPGLIARLMALPSLRRRPYPILLDRDGELTSDFPHEDGKATLIRLRGLRVEAVAFAASGDDVRSALEAAAPSGE